MTHPNPPEHPYPAAQPPPADPPANPPTKKPVLKWALIGAGIALLAALIVVPAFIAADRNRQLEDYSTAAAPPDPTYGSEEWPADAPGEPDFHETEPAVPSYTPRKADWALTLKTTDQTCYGSDMGCSQTIRVNVEFKGTPAARAALPDQGVIELTYKMTGQSGGPVIGSLDIYPADQTAETDEQWIDTPSRGTKIKVVVQSVEYNPYG